MSFTPVHLLTPAAASATAARVVAIDEREVARVG